MKMEAFIQFINPVKVSNEGTDKEFKVVSVGLRTEDDVNGTTYSNYWQMQASQQKISLLDNLNVGDKVGIDYGSRGSLKIKEDMASSPKNLKKEVIYSNLNINNIVLIQKAGTDNSTPAPDADKVPF